MFVQLQNKKLQSHLLKKDPFLFLCYSLTGEIDLQS